MRRGRGLRSGEFARLAVDDVRRRFRGRGIRTAREKRASGKTRDGGGGGGTARERGCRGDGTCLTGGGMAVLTDDASLKVGRGDSGFLMLGVVFTLEFCRVCKLG